ncbi:hypothetical protein [Bacillus atrophaeus]|uniref:hypothetical protein n=1 Tax=Bacillus atrophaeus TaxID=1452 RepID=UPI0022808FB3|nr:hypothetical protein [Bacillus atrophaeus]MCY8915032.1 hypothetical protein [Bacillus atrophaeus]MEC0927846.1 hypothetical protein [Bacillus atrophaeus]
MIAYGARHTPPYDDTGVKDSIHALKTEVSKLADTVETMDVSEEVKQDIETLKTKVRLLEESSGSGSEGATDGEIQSMRADIEAFGKVLDTHIKDTTKHVTNSDRTKWDGFDTQISSTQKALSDHTSNSRVHVSDAERTKWNQTAEDMGAAQKFAFTDTQGLRTRLADGTDIFTVPPGFYYGSSLRNIPLDGEGAWYYVDVTPAQNGMRKLTVTRSASNETYIGTIHTDGNFRGWKKLMAESDFMAIQWYDLKMVNGASQHGKKPQYARWGNLLMLKGDVSLSLGVAFASLPMSHSPYDKKAVPATVYGTTGTSKLYIDIDGSMTMVGFDGNDQSKISAWSLDLAVPY